MDINQYFRNSPLKKQNTNFLKQGEKSQLRASLRTEKLDGEKVNIENNSGILPFESAVVATPIFFTVMGGIVIFHKFLHQRKRQNVLNKVCCKKCHFFSNNKYLKCTLHPTIVLTEEAKNCSDYQPKEKKYFQFSQIYGHKQN